MIQNISAFTGKNLSSVKEILLSMAADVDDYVKPRTGLKVDDAITYDLNAPVVSLVGTFGKCTWESIETMTEHGEMYATRVAIEVPKILLENSENLAEILEGRTFLLVKLANDVIRILGDTGEEEDVSCTVQEVAEGAATGENKYRVEFTWQSSHSPYFYQLPLPPPQIGSEEEDPGGES